MTSNLAASETSRDKTSCRLMNRGGSGLRLDQIARSHKPIILSERMFPYLECSLVTFIAGKFMMTPSNGNIFRVTGPLCGEFTGPWWIATQGQSRGTLMFSLICAWTNGWVNNIEECDLKRHRAHHDVTVMCTLSRQDIIDWDVFDRYTFQLQPNVLEMINIKITTGGKGNKYSFHFSTTLRILCCIADVIDVSGDA